MSVLRDLYSESKACGYFFVYSGSTFELLSSQKTTCITPCSELQCRRPETRNASRLAPVNVHREPGGKRFWPHRLPQTALEYPETVEIRASKSKWNKLKSAENRYKRAEKVFRISLGAGCRRFESCHSDHLSQKNRLFRRFFCVISSIFEACLTTSQLWSER